MQALYSTLFEHNYENSRIVTGLADSFIGKKTTSYKLETRDKDSIWESNYFRRKIFIFNSISLGSNTHGRLERFLDIDDGSRDKIESQIEVVNDFRIVIHTKGNREAFVRTLTTIDFAIIPESATDPKTLKIIDYSENSGPYYYSGKDKHGNLLLTKLKHHWLNTGPDIITLVSDGGYSKGWNAFLKVKLIIYLPPIHTPHP